MRIFRAAGLAIMMGAAALAPTVASGGRVPVQASDTAYSVYAPTIAAPRSATSFSISGYLDGVAAISRTNAWAVGYSGSSATRPLIVHWNGTKWSQVANPEPLFGYLEGIADPAPDNVWAVGATATSTGANPHVLIMHWNGKAWSRAAGVPNVKGVLYAVTVVGNEVWAVGGTYENPLLVLHRVGGRWYVVPTPSPIARLFAVAATGRDSVWADGTTFSPSGGTYSGDILLHWNGTVWRQVNFPLQGANKGLFGMAAGPGGDIWAVGSTRNSAFNSFTALSMLWNGKAWRAVPVAAPANSVPVAVSFVAGDGAWVVGTKDNGLATLVLHWTGKAWAQVASPDPDAGANQAAAVAGTSASDVWVVGGGTASLSTPGQPLTIILHWNGKAWN